MKQSIKSRLKKRIEDELVLQIAIRLLDNLMTDESFARKLISVPSQNNVILEALIYLAYLKAKKPISYKEVILNSELPINLISKEVKRQKKILGMRYCKNPSIYGTTCVLLQKPINFLISERIKQLDLPNEIINESAEILDKLDKIGFGGSPVVICAAAIYAADEIIIIKGRKPITQREVSEAFEVTECAVRGQYHKLLNELKLGDEILARSLLDKMDKRRNWRLNR